MGNFPKYWTPHPLFWEPLLQKVRFGINFFYDFGWPLYQVTLGRTGVNMSVVQRIGKQWASEKCEWPTDWQTQRCLRIQKYAAIWIYPAQQVPAHNNSDPIFEVAPSLQPEKYVWKEFPHGIFVLRVADTVLITPTCVFLPCKWLLHGPQASLTWREPWKGRDTSAKVWIITSVSCIQSIAKPTIMSSTWLWNPSESYIWI